MLVIRRNQLDALAEPLRRKFAQSLAAQLRERHPVETKPLPETALRTLVDEAFALGARYGIENFDDVEVCAELLVVRGRGFDTADNPPELRDVLLNEKIPGEAKARWLRQNLLEAAD